MLHAHIISGSAFKTLARRFNPSENISAADYQADLNPDRQNSFYIIGNTVDGGRIEPKLAIAH